MDDTTFFVAMLRKCEPMNRRISGSGLFLAYTGYVTFSSYPSSER